MLLHQHGHHFQGLTFKEQVKLPSGNAKGNDARTAAGGLVSAQQEVELLLWLDVHTDGIKT